MEILFFEIDNEYVGKGKPLLSCTWPGPHAGPEAAAGCSRTWPTLRRSSDISDEGTTRFFEKSNFIDVRGTKQMTTTLTSTENRIELH